MNKVFLSIDYGTKRIGLALAFGPLAEPLKIISTHEAIPNIGSIIEEHVVTDLVVGESEGVMEQKSRQFANLLENAFHLPIHFQNETLSSVEVHENLKIMKASKSKKRQHIDNYAATAILQDFLDEQKPFSLL